MAHKISDKVQTAQPVVVEPDEVDYTDEQFQADLEKAMPTIERMALKARESLATGNSRKFPA